MKLRKSTLIIILLALILAIYTSAWAFFGAEIRELINNPATIVTGKVELSVSDDAVNVTNLTPIYDDYYEEGGYVKEFSIVSSAESLNACTKIYLDVSNMSGVLKNHYLKWKLVSDEGIEEFGTFEGASNQIEILPAEFIETGEEKHYTLYIWFSYDENVDQTEMLGETFSASIIIESRDSRDGATCINSAYNLQGKLVDDLGDPIVGATIEVHSDVKTAKTGSQGNYLIKGVTLGNHKLIIKDSNNEILSQKNISITTGNSNSAENATITIDDSGKTGFVNLVIDNGIALENPVANLDCVFNNGATPVQGDTYTDANGIYTYKYKQKAVYDVDSDVVYWQDMDEDGWGVQLIDLESTGAVVEPICSSINGKPVVSTSGMYANSQASSIDLSTLDTSNVTDMHAMFTYAVAEKLDLSTFNTSNVTNMSRMFYGAKATILDLGTFDTSNVTNMKYMFYYSKATSLDLSSFDTSNVTDMYGMFYSSQATSIDLSSFNTSNVTNMRSMFKYSKATSLDLSSFDTRNVTTMSWMFDNSQATSLDLSSFDTSNVTDMSYMFQYSKATSLDLSSFNTSNVTNMYGMFSGSQATALDLSTFNTSNVTNMSRMFYNSQATSLDLSSFDTSNVTNMYGMFQYSKATSLDLSSFNTSNVTNMYGMFSGSQATALDLSTFNTSNVTDMSQMFYNSQATSLDLSSFNTSNVTNMSYMFNSAEADILDLSSFNTSNVTNMSRMFQGAKATIGYARNSDEAAKFNATSYKPNTLVFN